MENVIELLQMLAVAMSISLILSAAESLINICHKRKYADMEKFPSGLK